MFFTFFKMITEDEKKTSQENLGQSFSENASVLKKKKKKKKSL